MSLILLFNQPAGGAPTYTQNLAGTLSFVGGLTRTTNKILAGTLTFAGALVKSTSRALAGVLTFTGVSSKTTLRALTGTLTFAGAISKQTTKLLSGALTFLGGLFATFFGAAATPPLRFPLKIKVDEQRSVAAVDEEATGIELTSGATKISTP